MAKGRLYKLGRTEAVYVPLPLKPFILSLVKILDEGHLLLLPLLDQLLSTLQSFKEMGKEEIFQAMKQEEQVHRVKARAAKQRKRGDKGQFVK